MVTIKLACGRISNSLYFIWIEMFSHKNGFENGQHIYKYNL